MKEPIIYGKLLYDENVDLTSDDVKDIKFKKYYVYTANILCIIAFSLGIYTIMYNLYLGPEKDRSLITVILCVIGIILIPFGLSALKEPDYYPSIPVKIFNNGIIVPTTIVDKYILGRKEYICFNEIEEIQIWREFSIINYRGPLVFIITIEFILKSRKRRKIGTPRDTRRMKRIEKIFMEIMPEKIKIIIDEKLNTKND